MKKIIGFLIILGGLILFWTIFENQVHKANTEQQVIYPTFYVTGSGGDPTGNIDKMISLIENSKDTPMHSGLTIIVDTEHQNQLKISGEITKDNQYPAISIGMVKGTNSSVKYQYALEAVMKYMVQHYKIPSCNMLGYSAGGAGIYRYLINYSKNSSFPKVEKFLSLDGQFNASTGLDQGESLEEVLKNGPQTQTKYYQYWLDNYQKMNPDVEVLLLDGNYDHTNTTDATVPFADAFSIYPLLQKNKNRVNYKIYQSTTKSHGEVTENHKAISLVKTFLYGE